MPESRVLVFFLAFCLCTFPVSTKKALSEERFNQVDQFLQDIVAQGHRLGVSMIVQRGDSVYSNSFGHSNFAMTQNQTEDTIVHICSMTKALTSVAVMTLVEEGKITMDSPISEFLPQFKKMQVIELCERENQDELSHEVKGEFVSVISAEPEESIHTALAEKYEENALTRTQQCNTEGFKLVPAATEITLKHLLTHTSGLAYRMSTEYLGESDKKKRIAAKYMKQQGAIDGCFARDISLADNAQRLSQTPLVFHPGTQYSYGVSTDLLAALIEVVSSQPFDEFLVNRVLEPLDMRDTRFFFYPETNEEDALLVNERLSEIPFIDHKGKLRNPEELDLENDVAEAVIHQVKSAYSGKRSYFSGGCGLYSTANDYNKFLQMIVNKGKSDKSKKATQIVSKKSIELLLQDAFAEDVTPLEESGKGDAGFSLGFGVERRSSSSLLSTGSVWWSGLHGTYFFVDPVEKTTAVFIAQANGLSPGKNALHNGSLRIRFYNVAAALIG